MRLADPVGRPVAILRPGAPLSLDLWHSVPLRWHPVPRDMEVLMRELLTVPPAAADEEEAESLVTEDLLVEEVSIDGMCGVY